MKLHQMTHPAGLRNSVALLLLTILLLAAGCIQNQPASSSEIQITLEPAPGRDDDYVTVNIVDADGQPVTGASVSIEGNMNHAGMVPVIADGVVDDADGAVDGVYQIPFRFTMFGDWILTVSVTGSDGATYQQDVNVAVDAESITVQ